MKIYSALILLLLTCILPLSSAIAADAPRKKILYVDSYNANIWSSTIEKGIRSILKNHKEIELRVFRMKTKSNNTEDFKINAGKKAHELIESWKPDLVITSDDNAAKYLIVPYYLDSDLPFVFCGINYDASAYNFPKKNITGMLEVFLLDESLNLLKNYAAGDRIGLLAANNLSSQKAYEYLKKTSHIKFSDVRMIETFSELKKNFIDIQKNVDLLCTLDLYSVKNFNLDEMIRFAEKNTRIPSTAAVFTSIRYSLLGTPKFGEEQGEWAANTALDILNGKSPADIPITRNSQGKFYLNINIAKQLGIKFPIDLLDNAHLITQKNHRVLFLSYTSKRKKHKYNIDSIEDGVLSTFKINHISDQEYDNTESDIEYRSDKNIFTLPLSAKEFSSFSNSAFKLITEFNPDAIIIPYSPEIMPFINNYSNKISAKIILCIANCDITSYNPDAQNIILLEDFTILKNALEMARKYADGKKIGYLAIKTPTATDTINTLASKLGIKFTEGNLVDTFENLKEKFLQLQQKVDLLCFFSICKIPDWQDNDAVEFFMKNTKVPTIAFTGRQKLYALIKIEQLPEEQGWAAGTIALDIIHNKQVPDISKLNHASSTLRFNKELADKLGIKFPEEIFNSSSIR